MKDVLRATALAVSVAGAAAAQTPLERLPKDRAGSVVRRAIDYAGGWNVWEATKTVEFRKTTIWYKADGSVERKRVQQHRYVLQPRLHARIEWAEDDNTIVLVNDGYHARKLIAGVVQKGEDTMNEARNATFGSHYVFGMPFKLTDPGARLVYLGRKRLADRTEAQKVRVTYEKGVGDAGGFHTWTYYFDAKTGRLCANHLNYGPGQYDFTEYHDDVDIGGMRVSTRRLGYRADARGRRGPKVSEILYEEIRRNVPLEDVLFVLPPDCYKKSERAPLPRNGTSEPTHDPRMSERLARRRGGAGRVGEGVVALPRANAEDLRGCRLPVGEGVGHCHGLEEGAMKCTTCGSKMSARRENYRYDASGLPGVTLAGVEVRRCAECGEHEVVIPSIEELHRAIVKVLVGKSERLAPTEIRFLRKYLGFSGADFAAHVGTTPETVSRWENGAAPMGVTADRLPPHGRNEGRRPRLLARSAQGGGTRRTTPSSPAVATVRPRVARRLDSIASGEVRRSCV